MKTKNDDIPCVYHPHLAVLVRLGIEKPNIGYSEKLQEREKELLRELLRK